MNPIPTDLARTLTDQSFAAFGMGEIAYVRPVTVNGQPAYAIIGADGSIITAFPTLEAARGAIIQNDMEPLSLH
ncbi:MAG: hypothetical protein KDA49_07915 [Rhodospirillaceae bacterium]|nr:hypothetical protein [Rhodospirillaceae bacterium]MCA8932381.1 hypothetical protein [Rhodospirillaceae bacterium]